MRWKEIRIERLKCVGYLVTVFDKDVVWYIVASKTFERFEGVQEYLDTLRRGINDNSNSGR